MTELSAVASMPSTTAGDLARRFDSEHLAGVEAGNSAVFARAWSMLSASRREKLSRSVTIDMDSTDVEVYGSGKQQVATTTTRTQDGAEGSRHALGSGT